MSCDETVLTDIIWNRFNFENRVENPVKCQKLQKCEKLKNKILALPCLYIFHGKLCEVLQVNYHIA